MTMHLASTPASIRRQPRRPGWRGVPLLVILAAALPAMAIAQDAPGADPGQETPTSIARLLAGRKAFAALTVKGKVRFERPRDEVFRDFTLSHLIHHRGQLSVYLRLLDLPVPGAYGPTAVRAALYERPPCRAAHAEGGAGAQRSSRLL